VAPQYYDEAFRLLEALRPKDVKLVQSFQTNGTLIDNDWCALFRKWDVQVGVSLDGPKDFHDANRVTRNGGGTFDKTMAGINLLRRHGISFSVIAVLSPESLRSPDVLYEFFADLEVRTLSFNVEETDGIHNSRYLGDQGAEEEYRRFVARFWQLAFDRKKIPVIREIEHTFRAILRPTNEGIVNDQVEPMMIFCVDRFGNFTTFSPEFLGMKSNRYGDFVLGNVMDTSIDEALESDAFRQLYDDILSGVKKCQTECEYFSVCGGGAPVNKLCENGNIDSAGTQFCKLMHKIPTDFALAAIEGDMAIRRRLVDPVAPNVTT
jgi:uncharacterized protein